MMRIIDMSAVNPGYFAIFDTVLDIFIMDDNGEECWPSVDDICTNNIELLERISLLRKP